MSEPNTNISWGCCDLDGDESDYTTCVACQKSFHLACLTTGAAPTPFPSGWLCPLCTKKPKGGNNDSTPVRSLDNSNVTKRALKRAAVQSPKLVVEAGLTREDVRDVVQEIFKEQMDNLLVCLSEQIKDTVAAALAPITKEIEELQLSVGHITAQYDDVIRKQTNTMNTVIELQAENAALSVATVKLSSRINQLEQYARNSNVEIQCVPERNNEDIIKIVSEIGKTIGCELKTDQISNCTRIAKLNPQGTRPRSIIVSFNTPRLRDTFLAGCIKFNKANSLSKLNSSHAGLAGEKCPIFVAEHLSSTNKALHAAARTAAREKGYKYVWVRNGRIFMRKTDTSNYKLITDAECILKLD